MGPLLWAGVAVVSFLAAGCMRDSEDPAASSTPDGAPSPSGSSSASPKDAAAKKGAPEPLLIYLGKESENPQAIRFYTAMNEKGVTDQNFDVGCPGRGKTPEKADGTVEVCEVNQYALRHHDKFYALSKEMARGELPWSLDDHDPTTLFDKEIRKKIRQAILLLENSAVTKDLDKNSVEYKTKLAVGLFYFVQTTINPDFLQWKATELKLQTRELREMGLGDFQMALLKMGGLGLSDMPKGPATQIATPALPALRQYLRTKTDFTAANVLFGVFEMAGLKPEFYSVPMKFSDPNLNEETINGHVVFHRSRRIVVGIPLGEKTRYFNLLTMDSDGTYPRKGPPDDILKIGLDEYVSVVLGARAQEALLEGRGPDSAIEDLNQAIVLDPSKAILRNFLGQAFLKKKNYEKATKAFQEAADLDPTLGEARYFLGEIEFRKGNWREGINLFAQAVEADPDGVLSRYGVKMLPRVSTILYDEPKHADAKKILDKMTARGPLPIPGEDY